MLEGSGEADAGREEKKRDDGEVPLASRSSSAYSTFLCLQLAGDDTSPLFEVACRALFRLRPQKLPRFVERLARFRSYANEITEGREAGAGAGAGATAPPRDLSSGDEEEEEGGQGKREETRAAAGTSVSSADARPERTPGGDDAFAEHHQQQRRRPQRQRSPSPPSGSGVGSRRTSEDNASEHRGRASRATTHPSSTVASREHSPEQLPPPSPPPLPRAPAGTGRRSGAEDDLQERATGPSSAAPRQHPPGRGHENAAVAPAYFTRALASLPPAVEDDRAAASGSRQRRARLSLLLGAGRFAEACGLLRSRAWEGSSSSPGGTRGSWRGDGSGAQAWRAAMRLLNELRRAAAAVADRGEDTAAAAAAAGSSRGDAASAVVGASGIPLPLQFRLAFEDALAETILADSPERMEAVMLCRPEGLTPLSVVRMVRRAAKAAAEMSVGAGTGTGTAAAAAAAAAGTGGNEAEVSQPSLSGSTQTLKMCLLLLLEGGARREVAAA